ncbi:hypothetical protein ACIPYS_16875 [Kitasatospora sp. NPDC089913]|uniref:hypothetical protein n=1 Tax=Kitasatospora sp. NPDC089913 TaxID=3364080 RepID=UPI0037FCE9F3
MVALVVTSLVVGALVVGALALAVVAVVALVVGALALAVVAIVVMSVVVVALVVMPPPSARTALPGIVRGPDPPPPPGGGPSPGLPLAVDLLTPGAQSPTALPPPPKVIFLGADADRTMGWSR